MKIKIIVPVYKSANNLQKLCDSVISQSHKDWELLIAVDSCKESHEQAKQIVSNLKDEDASKISISINNERKFALGNICNSITSSSVPLDWGFEHTIYGVIDGDDELCNNKTLSLIISEYENGANLAWTTYKRDDEGECVSDLFPSGANPYTYKWVSSHFRTFGNWIFHKINQQNFKDQSGNFFKRAYDQALMLPMLYYCSQNKLKTSFIPEICYQYNHSGSSTPLEEHTNGLYEHQLSTFIRSRGYIE
jgi:glycosyltransferase involved in cell wall biosynthesis